MSHVGGPFVVTLLACLATSCLATSGVAAAPPVALTNVLYEKFAHSPAQAYSRALYYERRGVDAATKRQLELARAGFALDMGMQADAKQILAGIDEHALAAPERARLHFYLARAAYGDRDWSAVQQELHRIAPGSAPLKTPMGQFLLAEAARLGNHLDESGRLLNAIPKTQTLLSYGRFNLGASAVAAGKTGLARTQFSQLVNAPAHGTEQLLIAERARVALSNLDIKDKQYDEASRLLSQVTATGEYGAQAVARLAELSMHRGDFDRAAQLWRYLTANWPWHPAAREAHTALPYSIEKAGNINVAYSAYTSANAQLTARQTALTTISRRIGRIDPVNLAHALRHPSDPDARGTLTLLQTGLKNSDWANWLADAQSQATAARVERLHNNVQQLRQRRKNLDILLGVDAEQQRRIHDAATRLAQNNDQARLDAIHKRLDAAEASLRKFAAQPPFDKQLTEFATPMERQQLTQINALMARAERTGASPAVDARIATLRNLVLYRIYDNLPVRIRARQRANETVQASLDTAQSRIDRIKRTSQSVGTTGSVSSRIGLLSVRTDALLVKSEHALDASGKQLIARLRAGVTGESEDIGRQLVYVHLAMARMTDTRMLTQGAAK